MAFELSDRKCHRELELRGEVWVRNRRWGVICEWVEIEAQRVGGRGDGIGPSHEGPSRGAGRRYVRP